MPTENLDAEPVTPGTRAPATRGFRLPADYYSAPLSEVRPLFPKWVPYGCGAAAAVFLLFLFAASALFTGARLGAGIDFVIGMSLGDLRGMFTSAVTTDQKDAFEREVKTMREALRTGRVEVANAQPFLQAMQKAIADKQVTPQEVENLTTTARAAATRK